jgi:hypothetical protein
MSTKGRTILAWLFVSGTLPLAQGQGPGGLLERAARQAEEFTAQFPALVCAEKLIQIKFGQGEKIASRRESMFDYLILMEALGDEFTVEESRLEKSRPQKDPPQALLATTGFAVMQVVFHPTAVQNVSRALAPGV